MICIVDTGCANLTSVKFALERLNAKPQVSADPGTITSAERVFLPGVGAAAYAMNGLRERGLVETIQALTQPVLGICLGMQILLESSQEGNTACLGLVPGQVKALDTKGLRSPHMGWNTLTEINDSPLFTGIEVGDYFYFVHSYAAGLSEATIASSEYGSAFSAAIQNENFYGVQFHPERSGEKGLQVLKNFLEVQL
ncbi:MAG: imidazole glycerol phosphate synthase subunit HisH [Candidatus Marinimicrobia bacterium]|nr:imidazole glycerol phosphate synthase subunit HisH [Candidatus Neomarinimicrobiota bacterium]MCF7850733.1 imidazole glycerol phosphate synthase subunit HisH [Candidatus Neomarinimicrobiota bacterium]